MIDIIRGAGVVGRVSLPTVLLDESALGDEVHLATVAGTSDTGIT
jgi:hypothetical protein